MELLVAYEKDTAGSNMAKFISKQMKKDGNIFRGDNFDLLIISTPSISADWLEEKYQYDGFVFLSKHAAQSGDLALTCHSTGNFAGAQFGGNERQIAVPHPHLQKLYLQKLWKNKNHFPGFQITLEATHHGPTALSKPTLFIEIGTTEKQWTDVLLCNSVAKILLDVFLEPIPVFPTAICIGGTHYPEKFTKELLQGKYALGTIIPKHALEFLDESLFTHILHQNQEAKTILLEWNGLGSYKQKILDLTKTTDLQVIKL